MKFFLVTSFLIITLPVIVHGQNEIRISAGINYSTESRILPFANISDYDLREREISFGSFLSPHISVSLGLTNNIFAVASVEYASKRTEYYGQTVDSESGTIFIPVNDGYTFVPVEFSLEYRLPFSNELWSFYIGGGGGLYFFNSLREVAGVKLGDGGSKASYGIHILSGMEYFIKSKTCLFFTMKFRDPEVEYNAEYASLIGTRNGKPVNLGKKTFYQKLSLEGTSFLLGVRFSL
jgi:hypothetical protein